MSKIQISNNQRSFTLNDKPFFYLADTVWSAFTNIAIEEWELYLDKRKKQGFNVLQINTLPQWDRSMSDIGVYPFDTEDGQIFEFGRWHNEYYQRARIMCKMAKDRGFQLALVVLWVNYVPGTWGSKMLDVNIMPKEFIKEYTEKVYQEFEEFDPVYIVSGDTDFDTPEAIEYYRIAVGELCKLSPGALKALHLKRAYCEIPEEFLEKIDFYMYQSGHNIMGQDMAYKLAEYFYKKYPTKPVINSEPCYEQMGYSGNMYGRFGRRDVRKAAWTSLLSGAGAGVAYGAHGLWNWHKINKPVNVLLGEGFDTPTPWVEALCFMGAWDYGYIKHIFESNHIQEITPSNELLEKNTEEIRIGKTNQGKYLIFVPSKTNLLLNTNLSGYKVKALDLDNKNIAYLDFEIVNEQTIIMLHGFERDVLIFAEEE